ncbi:MAG TPA: 7-carboxy-7-deazaguanine synthase QueE [Deltaproteobacteria bacterium]|nr:7-carboxy-7-deazaguanine synthase QueE [Deltaproteobacteria bacterium]
MSRRSMHGEVKRTTSHRCRRVIQTCYERAMRVAEIFYSLQGEGPFLGIPAIFLRLSGCKKPYCPWCDTPSAWDTFTEMAPVDICARAADFPAGLVVITGGEPFLQWNEGLSELHTMLLEKGYELHYETSGKLPIPDVRDAYVVCSPKFIEGSWIYERSNTPRVDCFKFIAWSRESLDAIDSFISRHALAREKICVMPLGATREDQLSTMELVFTHCRDKGYRMSPRLHILTFDTRGGV